MRPLRGIVYKLISVMIFIVMSALIKASADVVPPGEAVFFRSLFAMPVILIWLAARHEMRSGLKTSNPLGHFWRGLVGTTSMGLMFAGLGLLPLPDVTAINYAAPLLVVIFAAMFLGEQVGAFRITTVAIGLIGVLIVLSPRLNMAPGDVAQTLGAVLILGSATMSALAQIAVRMLVLRETTAAIVFYFSLTATLLSLLTLPFGWVIPDPATAAQLVLAGLVGGLGQIFLTSGYREAPASVVAPFDYSSILFALAIGYWVFDEVPTVTMLVGASVVVFAGVLIIWRERRLGLERTRQRKALSL